MQFGVAVSSRPPLPSAASPQPMDRHQSQVTEVRSPRAALSAEKERTEGHRGESRLSDEESSDDEGLFSNAHKRCANGLPVARYSDEQMLSLMNLIVEKRVYFRAARRGSAPPIRAKWETVAKEFFGRWPGLRVLMGPGLRKYYVSFATAFAEYVQANREGLLAMSFRPNEWQQTLLSLEEQRVQAVSEAEKKNTSRPKMKYDVIQVLEDTPSTKVIHEISHTRRVSNEGNGVQSLKINASCQTDPDGIHELVHTLRDYIFRHDRLAEVREEEVRRELRAREEENQVRRLEAEARMLEARNRELELARGEAVNSKLVELLVTISKQLRDNAAGEAHLPPLS